jgi:hypothetical protein
MTDTQTQMADAPVANSEVRNVELERKDDGYQGRMEELKSFIPSVRRVTAIILMIMNIFYPGSGTALLSCVTGKFLPEHLVIGALQLFSTFIIIGWFWALFWSYLIICRSYRVDS